MRRVLGAGLVLALAVVLGSEAAHAQKQKRDPQAPLDSAKLAAGDYVGKLKSVPGSDRTFILQIEVQSLVPNGGGRPGPGARPGAWRPINNPARANPAYTNAVNAYNNAVNQLNNLQNQLVQAQQQLLTARRPQQRQQAINRIQNIQSQMNGQIQRANNALNTLQMQPAVIGGGGGVPGLGGGWGGGAGWAPPNYKVVKKNYEVEFQAKEDAKVRTLVLPDEFDDKGNVKKWTKEELSELKGKGADRKLPGYESSMEKLEPDQIVKVTLVTMPKKKKPAKAKAKDKEEEKEEEKVGDEDEKAKQVKLIVIAKLADGESPGERPKRRKKD